MTGTEYVYAESPSGLLMRCKIEPDPVSGLPTIPGGYSPMRDPRWEIVDTSGLPFQIGDMVTLSEEYVGAHRAGQATGPIVAIDPHWCEPSYGIDLGWPAAAGSGFFPAGDIRLVSN